MKTPTNAKSAHNVANPVSQRTGLRASATKSLEHRYERRKIREQLRRLDWALNVEDGILA
jgi:hypothetical protein